MHYINFLTLASRSLALVLLLTLSVSCTEEEPKTATTPEPETENETDTTEVKVPEIAPLICDFESNDDSLTEAGWTKTFEDNFTGDLSKWTVWIGGAFNEELQHYQSENVETKDGHLLIHAKIDTVTGKTHPWDETQKTFHFTSGRLECKTNVSASNSTPKVRMMARMKLPSGNGLWPAFWSYGDPWPTQGEIDIVEARGQQTKQFQTNYFYGNESGKNLVTHAEGIIKTDSDINTCYHVYEMIWEKDKLTTIVDGTIVEVKTSGGYIPSMFGKQQHITINLAVGGLFFSNLDPTKVQEGTMEIDWIKVFTSN